MMQFYMDETAIFQLTDIKSYYFNLRGKRFFLIRMVGNILVTDKNAREPPYKTISYYHLFNQ